MICSGLAYSQIVSDYGMKIGMTASKSNFDYEPTVSIANGPFDETRISPNIELFLRFLDLGNIDFETQLSYLQKAKVSSLQGAPMPFCVLQIAGGLVYCIASDLLFRA